ncbi:MAG: outer membrane protein assembly factor BamA [Spirochaetota bacterium]
MQKLFTTILLLLSIAVIYAQTSSDWYIDKPIVKIIFKGLKNVKELELEGIIKPFIGKKFSDALFLDLQSKLYALDYFDHFIPNALPGDDQYNSIIIEFEVTERPIVDDIKINGNKNISKSDIMDVILLKRGDMVNKTKVRLDADAIKNLYLEKGYPDVDVQGNIEKGDTPDAAVIEFNIQEGKQTKIKKIQFSGNSFASAGTLRGVMSIKEQSLFSSGVFQESKLEEDIQKIESYYNDRGYIDTKVVDVRKDLEVDEQAGRNLLIVTIYIEEGKQYTYGGMAFEGNTLFSNNELAAVVRQKPGSILSKSKLEADFMRITDLYYNDGYIYNVISREEQRDEQNRTINYTVKIVERGRAHIENILIKGNKKTKDYVLYRELPVEVGDIFSKEKVLEGLRNLYNLQFFSSVAPTTPPGSVDGLMDLVINVEEGKTIDINFGVTFSAAAGSFPMLGFVKWSDKNFLGRGQELSVGTELSTTKQNLNFGFNENWLFGKRWSGGINFSLNHELIQDIQQDILLPVFSPDDPNRVPDPFDGHYVEAATGLPYIGIPTQEQLNENEVITDYAYYIKSGKSIPADYLMSYHSLDFSLGVSTGYRWFTNVGRFGIGTGLIPSLKFITYDKMSFRPYDSNIRENYGVWKFINKWWQNYSWDTRDITYSPSKGFYLSERLTFVGGFLFGTQRYIRSDSRAEAYVKIFDIPVSDSWHFKSVFAARTSFSVILPQFGRSDLDKSTDITRQELLYIDGMTMARGWKSVYDGEALWDSMVELRFPILEQYIWWDFYFSGTAMWAELEKVSQMRLSDYYFSFGAGARLTIPGIPIGLYLTKRFKFDLDNKIEWQTGAILPASLGLDLVVSFTAALF